MSKPNFAKLEKQLHISFDNNKLLEQSFTHRSYLNENSHVQHGHNERLEFLGDAVIELVVTEHLYESYQDKTEGDLTSYRAALVNADMLASVAKDLTFNAYLLLSKGEAKDVGRARDYILANTFEAFVGALYLDQGYKITEKFLGDHLMPRMQDVLEKKLYKDSKSMFQEKAQDAMSVTPTYKVIMEEGPDHQKKFVVGVFLGKTKIADGTGSSKQEAETDAATNALEVKGWA